MGCTVQARIKRGTDKQTEALQFRGLPRVGSFKTVMHEREFSDEGRADGPANKGGSRPRHWKHSSNLDVEVAAVN